MQNDERNTGAVDDIVQGETGGPSGITRRDFVTKAGMTAAALGLAGIPLAAACGSSSGTSSSGSGNSSEPSVVRFVFAPDPVWCYMQDTGIVAKYEELYRMKIVNTTTWDETAWFVGGHADIASMGTYEVPTIAQNSGKDFVSFGQYNMMRDSIFVRSDSPYHSMEDLKGKRVATPGTGASMLMYAAMFKKQYGLDLRIGGGDFDVKLQEFVAMPAALEKGDCEASFGLIDFEIPYVSSGKHRWLYPDQPTGFEYYKEYFDSEKKHMGVMCNLWVTTRDWYQKNPKAAEGFNVMWQEGVNEYYKNKEAVVRAYPDLFTTTNDAEVKWFLDYMEQHDQTVKTVYMNQTWVDKEKAVFGLLKETGFVKSSTPDPEFMIMSSPSSAPPEAKPPSTV